MIVACEKQGDNFNKHEGIFTKLNLCNIKRNKSCESFKHMKLIDKKRKTQKKKSLRIQFQQSMKLNEHKKIENLNNQNINLINAKSSNNINNLQNINSNKDMKSNLSSSMGKNFILKSDFCKSTVSNNYQNHLRREESNPLLSYYGIDKPPKNVVNDYLLFVKKLKGEIDDIQELFDKPEDYINKTKKEIIISTYLDDEETIKYIDVNEDDNENESESNNKTNSELNKDDSISKKLFQNPLLNMSSNRNISNSNNNTQSMYNNSQDIFLNNQNNYYNHQNNFGLNFQNNYMMNIHNSINQNSNYQIYNNQNRIMNNNNISLNISNYNYMNNLNNNQGNNFQFNNLNNNQNNSFYNRNQNPYMNNNIFNNNKQIENNQNNINIKQNFQNENYSNYNDTSLAKIAPYLIKEQSGCRFIQEKIQSHPTFANDLLFPQLKNSLPELICDQFGNYLFQVLLDVLSFENLSEFLTLTQQSFFQICISAHGTRVIQKLVDKVSSSPILLNKFIYNICSENLKEIIKTPYGNHIIQKYLSTVHNQEYTNFIFQIVKENFLEITNSKHGVCVVQKCISEGDEIQRPKILNLVLKNLEKIINDQFGNYVIQYILITNDLEFNEINDIIDKISENIIEYCKKKFSANVIEKCFENSNEKTRNILLNNIIEKDPHSIIDLLMDPFGNYVIQKALIVEKGELYTKILQIITKGIGEIKKANFGNKLIVKLISKHKELGEMLANNGDDIYKNNNQNNNNFRGNQNRYNNYHNNKNFH